MVRHDISNELCDKLESHLPGRRGICRGIAKNIINAVIWIFMHSGLPDYGHWKQESGVIFIKNFD